MGAWLIVLTTQSQFVLLWDLFAWLICVSVILPYFAWKQSLLPELRYTVVFPFVTFPFADNCNKYLSGEKKLRPRETRDHSSEQKNVWFLPELCRKWSSTGNHWKPRVLVRGRNDQQRFCEVVSKWKHELGDKNLNTVAWRRLLCRRSTYRRYKNTDARRYSGGAGGGFLMQGVVGNAD